MISALGFSDTKAMLLACPPYICAALGGIAVAWSSGRFHERCWHITGCLCVAGIGYVAAAATLNPAGRYIACFVFPVGSYSTISVVTSWGAATLSQNPEKKAVSFLPHMVYRTRPCCEPGPHADVNMAVPGCRL